MNQTEINIAEGSGARLRKAREAAGLSVAEVGQRLRMPVRVVESLEAEDWSRLGAPVFVRGQLRSYGRLFGLSTEQIVADAPRLAAVTAAELTPRSYTPRMQRVAEQTARRAVYIVLTAAILVPVWLATRPHAERMAGEGAPLDAPAVRQAPADAKPQASPPLMASMTPLPARRPPALTLRFSGDSWVQILGSDGAVLESGLLRAGEERNYREGEVARMVLGNASTVSVLRAGEIQDLAPYLRANVARFTVSSDGSLAPPVD